MCFEILDFDDDSIITELDLYAAFKIYEHEDEIFIKAFSQDLILLEEKIIEKKTGRGLRNTEVASKLTMIE
jgi:hypothetical protein